MNMNTRARVHASSNRANEDKQEGQGVADRCRRPFLFFSVARVHPLSLSLSSRFAENTRYETRLDLIYAFLLKAIGEGRDSRFRCFQVFPRVFRSVMERGNGVTTGET